MYPAVRVLCLGLFLSGVIVVAADSLRTTNNGMTSIQKQNGGARGSVTDGKTSMGVTMTLHDMGSAKAAVLSQPVALSNKNNVVSGSQVVVANSQVAMTQNDRFRISGGTMSISGTAAADSEDSSG